MDASVTSAYAQLLSVGVLWIGLHCSGMCGPLVLGLDLGRCVSQPRARGGWLHVLAYQAGKASIYAVMGACAGLLGGTVASGLEHGAPVLSGVLGFILLASGFRRKKRLQLVSPAGERPPFFPRLRQLTGSLAMATSRLAKSHTLTRSFLLGAMLSVLPCMIVVWVLTLAASTGSALHGALLMVLLVVMNSAPLVGVSLLPGMVRGMAPLQRASRHLMSASGCWLLLVSAAAAGLIPHASLAWQWFGRGYVVMFW